MKTLKKYLKYIIWIILGMLLTSFLTFLGLNANFKEIDLVGNLPEKILLEKAEATKTDGRIYGYVTDSSLNGKYIKIKLYDSESKLQSTEYLEISGVPDNGKKLFKLSFGTDDVKKYNIEIVDNK